MMHVSNLDNYNISDDTDWDYMTGLGHGRDMAA
jgi:hypothetical protein